MFRNVLGKLPALALLIGLVSLSIFVFHTLPLYGAELIGAESPTASDFVVVSQDGAADSQNAEQSGGHTESDFACRSCHSDTDAVVDLPSGESFSAQVDMATLAASAHGDSAADPLICTSCHPPGSYQFPHDELETADLREYQIAQSATCERCHTEPHLTGHPGADSENPVICTDCHGSHDALTVDQLHAGEGTAACVDCHTESGVDLVDPAALTGLINTGLFAQQQINNDYCLACHSQPGLEMEFPNGDTRSVTVDGQELHDSVHGASNSWDQLACTDCHIEYRYPHEPLPVESSREYTLQQNLTCERCHEQNFDKALDSVHGEELLAGNLDAAACTDCHGSHDTPTPDDPRQQIPLMCEQCHTEIFNEYAESIHGEALYHDDPDAPTCIDCHGVHDINDPTTIMARVRSPELCAGCHADEEMMARHDISTDVFETYGSDFHGTTTMLFDPEHPNADPTKAVCYDCHGVHDIKAVDDPEAGIKQNLLETCQQCHPDATANFSDSWTSHFPPSLENNTLVYLVNLFYRIVIPFTLGFLIFLVFIDVYHRVRMRLKSSSGN